MASGIVERYLAGEARDVFPSHFGDRDDRRRAVARALRPLRPEVAAELEAQNAVYGVCAAREANLRLLRAGCAAVVTGQQVGLLLGPLYTVYKAASAIAVARALSAETGEPVVPVFWLQTEDHDLPEVASCHVLRRDAEPVALALPAPEQRISLEHVALPPEIDAVLAALRQQLDGALFAREHCDRLARHYRAGAGYAQAFAGLLAELFADEGLVFIDPRRPALAVAAAPVHERGLLDARRIGQALCERSAALQAAGFEAPVHVRPDAPLSFFHPQRSDGPRYRLLSDAAVLREVGGAGAHTRQSLLATLHEDPLRFSSSALLRPIVQDCLLPTAAYVGGPGELAYFAQMAPLYAAYEMPMPLLVPRARVRVLEPKAERLLRRYELAPGDESASLEALLARCTSAQAGALPAAEVEQRLSAGVKQVLAELSRQLPQLGSELESAADNTRAAFDKASARFARKYQSALLHRHAGVNADLQRLKALLQPLDQPQERVLCFSYFAARHGERGFLERVFQLIEAWDPSVKDLRP